MKIYLVTAFQCLSLFYIKANPPEKRSLVRSFQLIESIGKTALIKFSKAHYPGVTQLTEAQKSDCIKISEDATVAILLHEFATGTGPSARYYFSNDPFSTEILNGPGVDWILRKYLTENQKDNENIRYQFSPKYLSVNFGAYAFSLNQHYRTLAQGNMSQFVLGSFNASITKVDNQILVHIWNRTSKKSLFWGLGNRVQRPRTLGTITQHIYLTISPEQLLEIISKVH